VSYSSCGVSGPTVLEHNLPPQEGVVGRLEGREGGDTVLCGIDWTQGAENGARSVLGLCVSGVPALGTLVSATERVAVCQL
jgi:hypothetical protein